MYAQRARGMIEHRTKLFREYRLRPDRQNITSRPRWTQSRYIVPTIIYEKVDVWL